MQVQLTSEQEMQLSRMADAQGRAVESIVQEAVERILSYDDWFLREVDKGLDCAEREEFVSQAEMQKFAQARFPAR